MFKNIKDKVTLSGMTVLMIGVALLIATFVSAYGFLTRTLSIMSSGELVGIFGGALAPLIETCIHIMYLGVMGWIGSLLTIRGVTIMANAPKMESVPPQKPAVPQPKPIPQNAKKTEPQKEAKPEPEFVVIPPEQVVQPQPESKEPQKNNSSQQPANNQ